MKKYKWLFVVLNFILLLIYFNYSIVQKEKILKEGQFVLLKLAPVDPRSLMQGDYMDLQYSISGNITNENYPKRGYCVVRIDDNNVASKVRVQSGKKPLHSGEYLIKYTMPQPWSVSIGAESFFFQEGHARRYESAEYGGLKIDDEGNSLLVGLYNGHLQKIE